MEVTGSPVALASLDAAPKAASEGKAPRKERADKGKPRATRGRRGLAGFDLIEERLTGTVTQVAVLVSLFPPTRDDGAIIAGNAENFVHAWVELAKTNKDVHRALSIMCESSAWAGVVSASLAMGIPIAANHGLVPAPIAALMSAGLQEDADAEPLKQNEGEQ